MSKPFDRALNCEIGRVKLCTMALDAFSPANLIDMNIIGIDSAYA